MAKGFKHGPGGTSLNFDVKTYPSAETLLAATPKENTIGIITTTPIAGWIFSATEPEGLAEGIVWILTGVSSPVEFNALKKNGIDVYPTSVKQYVNGAWVDLTAKSYQNGEWVEWWVWDGELYDSGNQYEEYTGGWEVNKNVTISGTTNSTSKVTFASGYMQIKSPSAVSTVNKIDITNYSTLCFDVDVVSSDDGDRFGVFSNYGELGTSSSKYIVNCQSDKTGRQTIRLDISSVRGSYYVIIATYSETRKIYKVWME